MIELISATENPIEVISRAAGTSWNKDDTKESRVYTCYKEGHLSVFEHASFTVKISGISRACANQLVRHRIASYCQESQRYVEIEGNDWYVTPPDIENKWSYDSCMANCLFEYKEALKHGVKKEDARYMLPLATKTTITMTMNLSSFYNFLNLRTKRDAQWEIRNLAWELYEFLGSINDEWNTLMDLWDTNRGRIVII